MLEGPLIFDFWKFWKFWFFESDNCFEHLALPESNSQPKSVCERCGWMLFSWIFVFYWGGSFLVVCSSCFWFVDIVFTSRPHWNHGWRFTVRSKLIFWNRCLFWVSSIVKIEFAAEKCVRTMGLNVVFMNFCVFLGCIMLGCLFVRFSNFLTLSLQAVRAETLVDGLPRAVRFDIPLSEPRSDIGE